MYTLLYILSAGHSGSTLLDLLAGSIPGVFSTGEVVHLPWQAYRDGRMCELHQDVCTCGAPLRQCCVWGAVLDRVGERLKVDVRAEPLRLKTHVLTTQAYRKSILLPYKLAREAYFRGRGIGADRVMRMSQRVRGRHSWAVFDALHDVTGAQVIIDSSKDVIRYEILRAARPDRVRPVVLVRDARGVIGSAAKQGDPCLVVRSLAAWEKVNRRILHAVRRQAPLVVRYEDLAARPAEVRARLAASLGLEAGPFENRLYPAERHLVAGNPMRYAKDIVIRPDEGWRQLLNAEQQADGEASSARIKAILSELAM
jgi:hypothetical protein